MLLRFPPGSPASTAQGGASVSEGQGVVGVGNQTAAGHEGSNHGGAVFGGAPVMGNQQSTQPAIRLSGCLVVRRLQMSWQASVQQSATTPAA
ncbi:MAG: hypothetical protein U0519_05250 [Candidatus Gracilibacteria bacterium]